MLFCLTWEQIQTLGTIKKIPFQPSNQLLCLICLVKVVIEIIQNVIECNFLNW